MYDLFKYNFGDSDDEGNLSYQEQINAVIIDFDKIVSNNEIHKLDSIKTQNVNFIKSCIAYDNVEFLQLYILKFNKTNNNQKIIIYKDLVFHMFELQRTNLINMLIRNEIDVILHLDFIKDLKKLKNILEYCRVNDFKYNYCDVLIEKIAQFHIGNEELIDEIFKNYNLEYKIVDNSIDRATFASIQWYYKKYKEGHIKFKYSNYAIQNAITTNSIELLKWWIDHSDEFELKYHNLHFYNTKIETLKFLVSEQDTIKICITPKIFIKDFISHRMDIDNDQIIVYDWLFEILIKNNYHLNFAGIYIESIKILNWLYDKYQSGQIELKYTKKNFIGNICNDSVDCIKWWFSHNDEFNLDNIVITEDDYFNNDLEYDDIENTSEDACDDDLFVEDSSEEDYYEMSEYKIYIENINLAMAKFLYFEQKVIKMNIYIMMINRIFIRCHIHLVELFYNARNTNDIIFDYTSDAIDYCIHTYALDWWIKHMDELELKYTSKSLDYNFNYNVPRCIKWWYDNRYIIKPKFTRDLLIKYVNTHPNDDYLLELLDFQ
jgi:hypothetical protein